MKRVLLIAFCASLFAISHVSAQKQVGNEKNLQVLFSPFRDSAITVNGIAFRKFNPTGTKAWRVNFFFGYSNNTAVVLQADTGDHIGTGTTGRPEEDSRTRGMTIGIRPGFEWHSAGTERLSPYMGLEAIFSITTYKVETDTAVSNQSNSSSGDGYKLLTMVQTGKGSSTTFGINLIAGVDYYFVKNLSLGAELGFGFSTTSMPDIESQTAGPASALDPTIVLKDNPLQVQGKSSQISPNAIGRIKLGWLF